MDGGRPLCLVSRRTKFVYRIRSQEGNEEIGKDDPSDLFPPNDRPYHPPRSSDESGQGLAAYQTLEAFSNVVKLRTTFMRQRQCYTLTFYSNINPDETHLNNLLVQ
jgi:hypothetical protein